MKFKYRLYTGLLIVVLLLTLPYVWQLFGILFMSPTVSVLSQLELYQWVAVGIVIAVVIGRFTNKNLSWLETFSHESAHTVMALLFLRRVHSFHADEGSGVVFTSGTTRTGLIPMALAPYCLPIFTYLLLFLRPLIDFHSVWIFDILIGMSLAFHVRCFKHQTGNHQSDINQYPLFFSYAYIYLARLINCCIIVVAFFPRYNVFSSIWRWLCALYDNLISFFGWIF